MRASSWPNISMIHVFCESYSLGEAFILFIYFYIITTIHLSSDIELLEVKCIGWVIFIQLPCQQVQVCRMWQVHVINTNNYFVIITLLLLLFVVINDSILDWFHFLQDSIHVMSNFCSTEKLNLLAYVNNVIMRYLLHRLKIQPSSSHTFLLVLVIIFLFGVKEVMALSINHILLSYLLSFYYAKQFNCFGCYGWVE